MTRKNVAWNSNAILTHLAVQQAAPANNPARFFAKSFRLQRRNGSRPRRNMSGVVPGSPLLPHESASYTMRGISGASCNRQKRLPSRDAHTLSWPRFYLSPFTSEQDKIPLAPGVLPDPAPQPLPLHSIRSCGLIKPDRHELVCFFGTAHSRPDRPSYPNWKPDSGDASETTTGRRLGHDSVNRCIDYHGHFDSCLPVHPPAWGSRNAPIHGNGGGLVT